MLATVSRIGITDQGAEKLNIKHEKLTIVCVVNDRMCVCR